MDAMTGLISHDGFGVGEEEEEDDAMGLAADDSNCCF